jgi:uncharacterized FlaG/YvyC family protein
MKIAPDPPQGTSAELLPASSNRSATERVSTPSSTASTVENASTVAAAAVVTPVQRETDITFRRDSNGRIYYVVSDAKSGEEILEVPPKEVRDVSQGIEDYLKQEQSKSTEHVKLKA